MFKTFYAPTRRTILAASATAGAVSLVPALMRSPDYAFGQTSNPGGSQIATNADAIRPFSIDFPEETLVDLRRRINATKWPDREIVSDTTQGVQLATMQAIAGYWGTQFDWRKIEARLKAMPQFITEIDGLDVHFVHVRSKHENALPMIVTHGWPGSIIEQLKIVDPLTDPTMHGATAADAFHLVIP
ncbi:MAG: epoxide hydrolase N-terminal domain-containing protein, partial [Hyphomicrobiales bacterium]|nr:epoxide hydrolase N-terminal domain-containing protein [Hyphomicrobiales bacterium]